MSICSAANSARMGYEEHIPGQTRDWNEELQTTRELPRKTLPERLIRERAIFKVRMIVNQTVALLNSFVDMPGLGQFILESYFQKT